MRGKRIFHHDLFGVYDSHEIDTPDDEVCVVEEMV